MWLSCESLNLKIRTLFPTSPVAIYFSSGDQQILVTLAAAVLLLSTGISVEFAQFPTSFFLNAKEYPWLLNLGMNFSRKRAS